MDFLAKTEYNDATRTGTNVIFSRTWPESTSSRLPQTRMREHFPIGYGRYPYKNGAGGSSYPNLWPWSARILPYLGEQAIYDMIKWSSMNCTAKPDTPALGQIYECEIACFMCPSDPLVQVLWNEGEYRIAYNLPWGGDHQRGRTSYGGNFGSGSFDGAAHGYDGAFLINENRRIDEITDGTSQTMLLAEILPGHWRNFRGILLYSSGPTFVWDYAPNDPTPDYVYACDELDNVAIGGGGSAPCVNSEFFDPNLHYAFQVRHTARSEHSGGVNVTMCDGSTRFVSNDVDLDIWHTIGSPNSQSRPITANFDISETAPGGAIDSPAKDF